MSLLAQIEEAGVVGLGGAGFPTHRKLSGQFSCLIANGAECEPLLRTDRFLMRTRADDIVRAMCAVKDELGIDDAVIGLKAAYTEEIAALEAAIQNAGAPIRLHKMKSFYPAGDEQTLVHEVTGRVVPPGGIPAAVGCVVDNIGTLCAVADAMDGKPLVRKLLTVTGLVQRPTLLDVPVGTPLSRCIALAGGISAQTAFVVNGGPMMGRPVPREAFADAVVTKTTSGILVLPAQGVQARAQKMSLEHMLNQAKSACIQCRFCTDLCPRYLLGHPLEPHRIMRKMAHADEITAEEMLADESLQQALICCECGICELYACPMFLRPRSVNAYLKRKFAAAGIRYPGAEEKEYHPREGQEERKVPTRRAAVRAGVGAFYDYDIREVITDTPGEVCLPLRMHIGAPCAPVVKSGEHVSVGDLIARPPQDALGAQIHASVAGVCEVLSDRIIIRAE